MSPSIMSAENSVVPVSTPDDDSSAFDRLRSAAVDLGVPAGAYRIGASADGAWCLFRDGLKWTVFLADRGERRQVAGFDTSHQAIAYLVGQLYLSHKLAGGAAATFDAGDVVRREIAGARPGSGVGAVDALTAEVDVAAALDEPRSAARSYADRRDEPARPESKPRPVAEVKRPASTPPKPSIPSGGVASLAAGLAAARAARLPLADDAKATRPRPGDMTAKPVRDERPTDQERSDAMGRSNRNQEESGLGKAGSARPDSGLRAALPSSPVRPPGSQPNPQAPRSPQPSPGERSTTEQRVAPQSEQAGHSTGPKPGAAGERPTPGNPAGGRRRNVPGTRPGQPGAGTGAPGAAGILPTNTSTTGTPAAPSTPNAANTPATGTPGATRALNAPGSPTTPGATGGTNASGTQVSPATSQPYITPRANAVPGATATPRTTATPHATATSGATAAPGTAATLGTTSPGTAATPKTTNTPGATATPNAGGTAGGAGTANAPAAASAPGRPGAAGVPSASGSRLPAQQGMPPQWKAQPLPGEPPLTLYRDKRMVMLPAGTEVDRYGEPDGNVTYAARTQYQHRSLPAEWGNQPYHIYRLQRPIEALAGVAVPWFEQPGGGTAFVLPAPIKDLLSDGSLVEVGQQPGRRAD